MQRPSHALLQARLDERIEIAVERVDGKAKLSQNLSAADRDGVVVGLRQEDAAGALAVADEMSPAERR